jgi:hypothetical protein
MICGCKMKWSFFGNGHGKGPRDGARIVIKHFIRCEQLNVHGAKLQNVKKVVNFLHVNLFDQPESSYTREKKTIVMFLCLLY